MTHRRQTRARTGEDAAAAVLADQGFVILERNYRCRLGEIDIVARDGQVLCFVEVKAVSGDEAGSPFEKVTPHKQSRIVRVAQAYLQEHRQEEEPCRFDVVGVWLDGDTAAARTEIRRDAFEAT